MPTRSLCRCGARVFATRPCLGARSLAAGLRWSPAAARVVRLLVSSLRSFVAPVAAPVVPDCRPSRDGASWAFGSSVLGIRGELGAEAVGGVEDLGRDGDAVGRAQ